MRKQTAIDWLFKEIILNEALEKLSPYDTLELFEQAIEMQKEEIKKAYRDGRTDQQTGIVKWYNRSSSDYYQETYGGKHIVDTNEMVEAVEKPMRYHCVPKEISDEEIEQYANEFYYGTNFKQVFMQGAKWYREQLKKK